MDLKLRHQHVVTTITSNNTSTYSFSDFRPQHHVLRKVKIMPMSHIYKFLQELGHGLTPDELLPLETGRLPEF